MNNLKPCISRKFLSILFKDTCKKEIVQMKTAAAPVILNKRSRRNTRWNLFIASLIFVFGSASIFLSLFDKNETDFFLEFRFMTMNGTIFTTLISLIILIVCFIELKQNRAVVSDRLYYFRLSSAVTEIIIAVVIAMSFLPAVPDSPNIFTFASFTMHVILPVLTVISFLINKTPVPHLHPVRRFNCSWLITLYAVTVISMITVGLIPQEKIPYSFLDFQHSPVWYVVYFGCFIYSLTYVMSYFLTDGNSRIATLWHEQEKPAGSERS